MILVDVNGRGIIEESITLVESLPLGTAVVLLVDHSNPRRIKQAIRAGVRGILSRDVSAEELGIAISAAETGLILLQPTFAVLLGRSDPSGPNSLPDPIEVLTTREHEILMLMSEGLGNKQIAARLQLSEYTVKFHVSSILSKLNAGSRTEAVSLGVKRGWIFL